jgi:branched-chain amino acid transport system ATP-binding protein
VTSLLEVDDVHVRYGDFSAVSGVSLRVDEGAPHAVVGANGAGKSTLLRAIAGAHPLSSGSIRFDGTDLGRSGADRRVSLGIVLVPEGRRLFPSLTVEENLLVGGFRRRPGRWTVERVYELFPMLGRLADRGAANLSGGEQQAVAIGRALMANPRLVLLDEVSLGLAPVVVRQLYAALPSIVESGTTPLLVEQDIGQALAVSRRVTCLLEGRVSLEGAPADLDRDAITAAYFGVAAG